MCETLKITQQIIRIYLHLIYTKNYQKMIILKTRVIPGIMNQRSLLSQTKPTIVKEIILAQEKNKQIQ